MNYLTNILLKIELVDLHEADQLLPLVYEELRKLAAARLADERAGQTLQATAEFVPENDSPYYDYVPGD